jgi:hypothetical protein
VVVVTVSGAGATVIESACVAVALTASWTRTTKLDVPAVVGVPCNVPSVRRDMPAGKVPDCSAKAYGGVPPVALTEPVYATPTCPAARLVVVMASGGGEIVMLSAFETAVPRESVTRMENEKTAARVGTPLNVPPLMETPSGRVPDSITQLYGGVPPAAVADAE